MSLGAKRFWKRYAPMLSELGILKETDLPALRMTAELWSKWVRLTNKVNSGKAYSLNTAIEVAKGEIIACIDADSMIEPDALKKMIVHFEDPKVASVTPALRVYRTKSFLEKL